MGAFFAYLGLLGSAMDSVERFVVVFFSVYQAAILIHILASFFRRMPTSLARVQRFLYDVCDPYLRIFRRFIPMVGPFDLSPIVGLIALTVIERGVIAILNQF